MRNRQRCRSGRPTRDSQIIGDYPNRTLGSTCKWPHLDGHAGNHCERHFDLAHPVLPATGEVGYDIEVAGSDQLATRLGDDELEVLAGQDLFGHSRDLVRRGRHIIRIELPVEIRQRWQIFHGGEPYRRLHGGCRLNGLGRGVSAYAHSPLSPNVRCEADRAAQRNGSCWLSVAGASLSCTSYLTMSPTRMMPPRRILALSPPRWTKKRTTSGWVYLANVAQGSHKLQAFQFCLPDEEPLLAKIVQVHAYRDQIPTRLVRFQRQLECFGKGENLFAFDECDLIVG